MRSLLRGLSNVLQLLGVVGGIGGFQRRQRSFFRGVVLGADVLGALKSEVLKHMRQTRLLAGVIRVSRVHDGEVREDGRVLALGEQEGQAVRQHLDRGMRLELFQLAGGVGVKRRGACLGAQSRGEQGDGEDGSENAKHAG